jgi:hypothetical protein
MTRKAALLALIPYLLLSSAPLWAQNTEPTSDDPRNQASKDHADEIIVRGQKPSDYKIALEAARVRVYDVFNALNSDDAFDVHCQQESATGRRMRRHVCRPQFKDDISNAAAKAWANTLKERCDGLTQECIFSETAGHAKVQAQAEEAREGVMQQRFALEMARVIADHPELQQAILDYYALERRYDEARTGKRDRGCERSDPPPRCTR